MKTKFFKEQFKDTGKEQKEGDKNSAEKILKKTESKISNLKADLMSTKASLEVLKPLDEEARDLYFEIVRGLGVLHLKITEFLDDREKSGIENSDNN